MNIKFKAKYLPVLAQFASKRDVRYFLNGFNIQPACPSIGGVYLTATNGHAMVFIHDPSGVSESQETWPIDPRMLSACKAKRTDFGDRMIEIDSANESMWVTADEGKVVGIGAKPVGGNYPNVSRLMPDFSELKPVDGICVNPVYFEKISKSLDSITSNKYSKQVIFRAKDKHSSIFGFTNTFDNDRVLFIVMPMRIDDSDNGFAEPEWLSGFKAEQQNWLAVSLVVSYLSAFSEGIVF